LDALNALVAQHVASFQFARLAALRLVLETFVGVKALFAGGESEL